MKTISLEYIIKSILLIILQVALLENLNIFSSIKIYPYILIILLFPEKNNRIKLMIFSFILGLVIDIFIQGNWIHTVSITVLSYLYYYISLLIKGRKQSDLNLSDTTIFIKVIGVSSLVYHFMIYILDYYSFLNLFNFFKYFILNTLITFLFSVLIYKLLFSKNGK